MTNVSTTNTVTVSKKVVVNRDEVLKQIQNETNTKKKLELYALLKKAAPRPFAEVMADLSKENDVNMILVLSAELARSKKKEVRGEKKAAKKAENKAKRVKNSRTLKALKRVLESLNIGAVLTLTVTDETGEELFANTVTVPEPKKKEENTETK